MTICHGTCCLETVAESADPTSIHATALVLPQENVDGLLPLGLGDLGFDHSGMDPIELDVIMAESLKPQNARMFPVSALTDTSVRHLVSAAVTRTTPGGDIGHRHLPVVTHTKTRMICPVPLPFHFSELFRFRNGSHRTAVAATAMTRIRLHPILRSGRFPVSVFFLRTDIRRIKTNPCRP